MKPGEVYEARYGPTPKNFLMLLGSLAFTGVVFVPEAPLYIRVLSGALFGTGSLLFLAFIVVRRVALRVGPEGITIAGNPIRYRATMMHAPWTEVDAIVLWKQHTASNLPYIGIHLKKDTQQEVGRKKRLVLGATVPHMPAELVDASRPINGWRLNRDRLAAAVARFAPDVQIIDAG